MTALGGIDRGGAFQNAPKGLAITVHGGFGPRPDIACWSDLAEGALQDAVTPRTERGVTISGPDDLRPTQTNALNAQLGRTPWAAESESAALLTPLKNPQGTAWGGGAEGPEFLRQSAFLAESWTRSGGPDRLIAQVDRYHFDVIYGQKHANHPPNIAFAGA